MSVSFKTTGQVSSFFERRAAALRYDATVPSPPFDGLSTFAPLWGIAMTFSLAADPLKFAGQGGLVMMALLWGGAVGSILLMVHPRSTLLLGALAALSVALYVWRLPVASNNKTISAFMNGAVLVVLGVLVARGLRGETLRETAYEHLRVIARGLLAVMYIYGIFHKINTDFLHPDVSCAVGLYKPLAAPFGLSDNLIGRYLSIYITFIVETITIVGLYWRRFFAVGLICGLVFHYVIPISAFSWYMDFSSLVLALYALSIPKAVSGKLYADAVQILRPVRKRLGRLAVLAPGLMVAAAAVAVVLMVSLGQPHREFIMVYHSVWIVVWSMVGGVAIVAMTRAAIEHLPYEGPRSPRQPAWLYLIPGAMFLMCLSPYVGLKTESSVNMFSNLHTEGGVSNHLLLPKPPYLFGYQKDLARLLDSSDPYIDHLAAQDQYMVMLSLKEYLRKRPNVWVTYESNGQLHSRVRSADFQGRDANLIERNLLVFKLVDFKRPKVCTH